MPSSCSAWLDLPAPASSRRNWFRIFTINMLTEQLIKQLFLRLLLLQLALLVLSISFSAVITAHFKYRLGNQLAAAFRNDLLMGDTRKAMLELPKTISGDFIGVKWIPAGLSQAFSIPEDIDFTTSLIYNKSIVPIYFDEDKTKKGGDLAFYYYRWMPIVWALSAWSLLFILSIPVWLRERRKIVREYALSLKAEINESRANLAAQVAHDIRSPLVALDAALKNTSQLPEKQRVIVRHAVNRIRDIANNLLDKNRQQPGPASTATAAGVIAGEPLANHLLSSLIDPVITEKRLQFESKPGITIDLGLTKESYGLFAKIQPVEFRRMLSNLINNAVEALGDKGAVDVRLAHEDNTIVLTISDDGKGIPPDILAKLGRKGETHGKAGGSGLGLFHARATAESWGGSLTITSALGKGTIVTIKLPSAEAPAYFVSELKLALGRPIVASTSSGAAGLNQPAFQSTASKTIISASRSSCAPGSKQTRIKLAKRSVFSTMNCPATKKPALPWPKISASAPGPSWSPAAAKSPT